VFDFHGSAEPNDGRIAAALIDDDGRVEPLRQEADPPIDLAKALLAVDVLGIFRTIALRSRVGDFLHHARPLDAQKMLQLLRELFGAFGRQIIGHRCIRKPGSLWQCLRIPDVYTGMYLLSNGVRARTAEARERSCPHPAPSRW